MTETMKNIFGECGELPSAQQLTEGTYNFPEPIDEYTQDFLQVCAMHENGEYTDFLQSPQQFKRSWQLAREKTASNGDLHFGHYKAGVDNHLILTLHYIMAEIPFVLVILSQDGNNPPT